VQLCSAIFSEFYPFQDLFDRYLTVVAPAQLPDDGVLLLWGGEDISPSLYDQKPRFTHASANLSERDTIEVALVNEARRRNIPILGICRGAQLMCALSGGSLFQHVDHHAGPNHPIELEDGKTLITNSYHHQMLNLKKRGSNEKVDHRLIAWTAPKRSTLYLSEKPTEAPDVEPEIVYFPKTNALCIQGHPEFLDEQNPFVKYSLDLVKQYCLK
jgi:hypothetical protein